MAIVKRRESVIARPSMKRSHFRSVCASNTGLGMLFASFNDTVISIINGR